jgi:hypothetical protein
MFRPFRHAEAQLGFTDRGDEDFILSIKTKKLRARRR